MRTIGLIGGMSWESTVEYYRLINRGVRDRLGPLHSARLLLDSLDFSVIATCQREGDWDRAGTLLAESARRLQAGGAGCILIGANTMHRVAAAVEAATPLPLLHIVDATGSAVRAQGLNTVLLLGTAFTMEQPFFRDRMQRDHGVRCLVPGPAERAELHRVIYEELCAGRFSPQAREYLLRLVAAGVHAGAQGAILGCTELGLLLGDAEAGVPVFDTAALHAAAAVEFALA
ncbi:aspartate/glutamate racemase family protein [Frateuria terrea]|uniref:Aspartate racemase n=1 Tax=Frateuria terrea TaxID=529704 RepID=A0A1H6QSE7_9GAMM|nr:aspartate/glutamate racemase family protein [Frateuria terrea]SEI43117.1 aspartate racemase [Frateuria terrea]SFP08417.1 aspartate racemase [Frateuria terrea]